MNIYSEYLGVNLGVFNPGRVKKIVCVAGNEVDFGRGQLHSVAKIII